MAKSGKMKHPQTPGRKNKRPAKNRKQQLIVGLMIVALVAMFLPNILPSFHGGKRARNFIPSKKMNTMPEPKFTKEGTLSFVSGETGETIRTIDMEKADNDMERQFGLMYRKSMPDSEGMLFLFNKAEPQSFWMHNTYISLDILFVDANRHILNIHKNAKTLSDKPLPSDGNAQYVVEVIGGFCDKYGVKPGDIIKWQ